MIDKYDTFLHTTKITKTSCNEISIDLKGMKLYVYNRHDVISQYRALGSPECYSCFPIDNLFQILSLGQCADAFLVSVKS